MTDDGNGVHMLGTVIMCAITGAFWFFAGIFIGGWWW